MKVLFADDHWMVRESLKLVMKRLDRGLETLEAGTFQEAREILRQHAGIDVMLVDLIMPGFDSFAGLRQLRSEFPDVPIVVVSVHDDSEHILRSISHGVVGYIPKTAAPREIERALERVLAGEVSFPREILQRAKGAEANTEEPLTSTSNLASTLTRRENEILRLLGRGRSIVKIAEALSLSPNTVRVHVGNLTKKLGLKDRPSLIHYAVSVANGKE
ncbi:response regulator transcription factor [Bradyrhizobium sp. 183]|uniref:response regulator transcription factor n=1 Tax=unclassified Bradyrhizobium TaxID=2631580 RepID=UPI001FFF25ED|nr:MULTISPECIES: response regulator transcription factor [unclassified Bradyrhizobium]UPJ79775.1 response regulator transcription factor [Bradyrhizobium sp. 184]UPJ87570.1 response regulator transcription factor [Bradyrhizobium sp. 183]